jgi:hypothetical protein
MLYSHHLSALHLFRDQLSLLKRPAVRHEKQR